MNDLLIRLSIWALQVDWEQIIMNFIGASVAVYILRPKMKNGIPPTPRPWGDVLIALVGSVAFSYGFSEWSAKRWDLPKTGMGLVLASVGMPLIAAFMGYARDPIKQYLRLRGKLETNTSDEEAPEQ